MQETGVKYLLVIPHDIMKEVRQMSVERKNLNAKVKTQKAIIVELLEKGLQQTRIEAIH